MDYHAQIPIPMTDPSTRLYFSTYGMLIHPQDAGKFLEILSRAQPCATKWDKGGGTTYEIKPREIVSLSLVPLSAIKYPEDLQDAVDAIREGGKEGYPQKRYIEEHQVGQDSKEIING